MGGRRSGGAERCGRRIDAALARVVALALAAGLLGAACAGRPDAVVHTVRPGETLYRISAHYDVPITAILSANGLRDPGALDVGQRLRIPGARRAPPDGPLLPPAGVRAPESSPLERPRSQFRGLGELRPGVVARWRARSSARLAGLEFAWPLAGAVSSGFGRRGGRLHEGIDVLGEPGALIRAAEAGRVVHSGPLGSYGNLVVVRHAGRFATAYAHARSTLVPRGRRVRRGEPLAEVGSSGNASGPHLHFEIRRSERALDPLLFLPDEP